MTNFCCIILQTFFYCLQFVLKPSLTEATVIDNKKPCKKTKPKEFNNNMTTTHIPWYGR